MGKIRVAQVLEATAGGTRKHVRYLAARLDPAAFDVTLICSLRRDTRFERDVEMLRGRGVSVEVIDMKRGVNPWSDARALLRLFRCFERGAFDVVHTHSSKAGFLGRLAARWARVPVVLYSPHCFYFQQRRGPVGGFFRQLERAAGWATDRVVTVSHGERDVARRVVPERKLVTIVNALDASECAAAPAPTAFKASLGIGADAAVVGTVSRLEPQKGYRYFFEAAARIARDDPGVRFLFVGGGREGDRARTLVDRLGIADRVVMTGELDDPSPALSIMDVFVLSSLWEGMPYVLLEAMAYAKPIVASRIPGVEEVLEDCGRLVQAADPAALAAAIVEVLSSPQEAARLGACGQRALGERHRLEDQIGALSTLYRDLLVEKRGGGVVW